MEIQSTSIQEIALHNFLWALSTTIAITVLTRIGVPLRGSTIQIIKAILCVLGYLLFLHFEYEASFRNIFLGIENVILLFILSSGIYDVGSKLFPNLMSSRVFPKSEDTNRGA